MTRIVVRPERIRQFGPAQGCTFCLITNPELLEHFEVAPDNQYEDVLVRTIGPGGSFAEVLSAIPTRCHVLVASPSVFFDSPPSEQLGERKLIAMACNSTPTDVAAIAHFLGVIERTDPERLEARARRFFDLAERSEHLEIVDERVGTRLRFQHLTDHYEWNQQAGTLEWGQQQIAPMGEISVLPIFIRDFNPSLRLALDGQLCLHGHPILHNGTPSFLRSDQARIHAELQSMRNHPIVADVRHGEITALRAVTSEGAPAARMLEAMFRVDSRYRIVWEIGFAINTFHDLLPGNHAMNEVYGATDGCLHWGLGLTPYTQYHLDILCPDVCVLGSAGECLLGSRTMAVAS